MKKTLLLLLLVALAYSQCQAGQMLINDKCAPVAYMQGCSLYAKNGTCDVCQYGYLKNCDGLCLPNQATKQQCCAQRDRLGNCTKCAPGLFLENGKCKRNIIDKCVAKVGSQCLACGRGFYLSSNKCWPLIQGCEQYLNTGACRRCSNSSIREALSDLKYELFNGICMKRKVSSIDNVSDSNCKQKNAYGCISCENNFYLNQNKECVMYEQGCLIYLRGRCQECSTYKGFVLDQSTGRCLRKMNNTIPNCIQYDENSLSPRCLSCKSGFRLIQNKCVEQNALPPRIKKQCAKGFVLTSDYKCKQAGGNLIKKEDQITPASVTLNQPGCIYQNGRCEFCQAPFVKVDGTCTILNCRQFQKKKGKISETYECLTCRYPYQLNNQGVCEVRNCAKYDNNICSLCQVGYHLRAKQLCVVNDVNCKLYNDDGVCEKCADNYFVSSQGQCMLKESNCAEQLNTAKGLPVCVACQDGFFLNRHNQCQKVDTNCQMYVNGACMSCAVRYFLYNDICFPYSLGCVKYNGKDCTDCKKGYSLFGGQCYGLKSLSMKLLGQDDKYNFDIYPLDISKSKYYIDNLSPANQISNVISSSIFSSEYQNPLLTFEDNQFANQNRRNKGWKAATNQKGQFIGYKIMDGQQPVTFYALQIQAIQQSVIKSFYLQYTKDGITWIRVDSRFIVQKYYKKDSDNSIVTIYFTGIYARAIRIVIDQYVNWPACKIEFFYYDLLRYKKIINLKSLKYLRQTIQTNFVDRVDNQLYINQKYFFDPQFQCYSGGQMACFTGLELCQNRNISKIELINDNRINGPSYVSQFYLTTSINGRKFECYNQCKKYQISEKDLKMSANGNYRSIIVNLPGLFAKNLRVYPTKWVGTPKLSIVFDYQ